MLAQHPKDPPDSTGTLFSKRDDAGTVFRTGVVISHVRWIPLSSTIEQNTVPRGHGLDFCFVESPGESGFITSYWGASVEEVKRARCYDGSLQWDGRHLKTILSSRSSGLTERECSSPGGKGKSPKGKGSRTWKRSVYALLHQALSRWPFTRDFVNIGRETRPDMETLLVIT